MKIIFYPGGINEKNYFNIQCNILGTRFHFFCQTGKIGTGAIILKECNGFKISNWIKAGSVGNPKTQERDQNPEE